MVLRSQLVVVTVALGLTVGAVCWALGTTLSEPEADAMPQVMREDEDGPERATLGETFREPEAGVTGSGTTAMPQMMEDEPEMTTLNFSEVLGDDRDQAEVLKPLVDLVNATEVRIDSDEDDNITDFKHNHNYHLTADIPNWIDEWVAPKEFVQWFSYYLSGYDNDESPVYIFDYGRWNPLEALKKTPGGREKATEIGEKYMQQGVYRILRHGMENNLQGVAVIIDFEGFSVLNYADPTVLQMFLKLWSHFNRIHTVLNYALLINTNFAAENFIRLMKPLWGNILDKCEIFGTSKSKWLPEVLRRIPKSELPPWFGGDESWRPLWIGGTGKATYNSTG